jgi:hypothetical protein
MPSWPRSGPTSAFYHCIPIDMHGPTCIFWANLTPASLQAGPCRCSAARLCGSSDRLAAAGEAISISMPLPCPPPLRLPHVVLNGEALREDHMVGLITGLG